jgi:hypothetical protein
MFDNLFLLCRKDTGAEEIWECDCSACGWTGARTLLLYVVILSAERNTASCFHLIHPLLS